MNRIWQAVFIVAGLVAICSGFWEVRSLMRLRRVGIRSDGEVVRQEITTSAAPEGGVRYAPVVSFTDEHGSRREFTSRLSSGFLSRRRRVGSPVPVVYLPGRPETARLDSSREWMWGFILTFGVGALFVMVAVIFGPEST